MRRATEALMCVLLVMGAAVSHVLAAQPASPIRQYLNLDLMLAQTGSSQSPAVPPSGVLPLSIRDSIALALKNNLDIAVEGYNPPQRLQALIGQEANFDPSAFLELTRADNRVPPGTLLIQGSRLATDFWDYNAGLRQQLPTGGTVRRQEQDEEQDMHFPALNRSLISSREHWSFAVD